MIQRLREKFGLTPSQLADRVGIDARRISDMERDRRIPEDSALIRALATALRTRDAYLFEAAEDLRMARKQLLKTGTAFCKRVGAETEFRPGQDRPNGVRLSAALRHYQKSASRRSSGAPKSQFSDLPGAPHAELLRYPEIVRPILQRLKKRKDYHVIQHFLRLFCLESRLEMVFALKLLDAGAKPLMAAPYRLGADGLAIIDPVNKKFVGHRRFPGLGLHDGTIVFAQVTLRGQPSSPRVDFLVLGDRDCLVVEIDGETKPSDPQRSAAIPVRTLRLGEAEVLGTEWFRLAG